MIGGDSMHHRFWIIKPIRVLLWCAFGKLAARPRYSRICGLLRGILTKFP